MWQDPATRAFSRCCMDHILSNTCMKRKNMGLREGSSLVSYSTSMVLGGIM